MCCDIDKKSNYSKPRVGGSMGTRAGLDIMVKTEISVPAVQWTPFIHVIVQVLYWLSYYLITVRVLNVLYHSHWLIEHE